MNFAIFFARVSRFSSRTTSVVTQPLSLFVALMYSLMALERVVRWPSFVDHRLFKNSQGLHARHLCESKAVN